MATAAAPRRTDRDAEAFDRVWSDPPGFIGFLKTINNIPIAQRYMATGFLFFLTGGLLALFMRIQLGTPENTFLDPETYNQLFTMHGTTMMFLFVIPFIEAIANYLLPLLIGTRDLPFPKLTALSYWTYLFGGIFLYSSFFFGAAPDGGWFAYVPLNSKDYSPGINMDFWDIGLSVAEVAAMGAAAELIVGVMRMRAPGMSLNRLPLFAWAMLVTAFMIIFAFTPLVVGTAMLELDRKGLTTFFEVEASGEPLLWQHLFWVFGHPEVYIMFIPAVGIVSHVVQVFARRPVVAYPLMVLSIVATAFLSFGLWVHHMFTTGLSPVAMSFFTAASVLIAIPNGVQIFGWLATLWTGRPVWRTPLLFVIGFIVIFTLGGVTGVMVGFVPFDWQAHDSYFVVAHLHYVLIGGVVFPLFAGLYYWLPKVTGRMLSERLGRWNFWVMFVGFNVAFFPMHVSGLLGMPRRVYTYPANMGLEPYNLISTIGAFAFALGVLLFVANFFYSLRRGERAGNDPWGADSLEWSETSPPPQAQFATIPVVSTRHPLWEQESLEPPEPGLRETVGALDHRPTRWRGALAVSGVQARPLAIVQLPGLSIWPFVLSVAFLFIFVAALVENAVVFWIGAAVGAVALVGWFTPGEAERLAEEEMGGRTERGLPLALAGPLSNGWWGTLILLLILGTALATLVASYYYLGEGPSEWPTPNELPRQLWIPAVGTVLAVLAAVATRWATRSLAPERAGRRRLALGLGWLLWAATLVLAVQAWRESGLYPDRSAYASAFLSLIGFVWLVLAILLAMLGAALVWAVRRPESGRGHGVALNTSLVSYFALGTWIVTVAVLYLSPRIL